MLFHLDQLLLSTMDAFVLSIIESFEHILDYVIQSLTWVKLMDIEFTESEAGKL